MDHFAYKDGELYCEDVSIADIAKEVGTPVYIYSRATLERHFTVFNEAFDGLDRLVCFAVKANSNVAVLKTLARLGAGADVVSLGELMRAQKAGIDPGKIVFSGVGKTQEEMKYALKLGIKQFNVESEAELALLNKVALDLKTTAPVSLRINPDVDAKTHEKISTGKSENKFGIPWQRAGILYDYIKQAPGLTAVGVDVHIGSQLTELKPFEAAFTKVADLVEDLRAKGHTIENIDLGGGLGIPYADTDQAPPLPSDYADIVRKVFKDIDCTLIFEPGRMIAGNAGVLATSLIYEKTGENHHFYILDAAMNDLCRPAMYGAHHEIVPVKQPNTDKMIKADFVGPVCETGDTFAQNRPTSHMDTGDLAVIRSAGAYGAVMASTYNSRPLIAEVLVSGSKFDVIRRRQSLDELIGLDRIPDWLQ